MCLVGGDERTILLLEVTLEGEERCMQSFAGEI
jgi:hypothetical protein